MGIGSWFKKNVLDDILGFDGATPPDPAPRQDQAAKRAQEQARAKAQAQAKAKAEAEAEAQRRKTLLEGQANDFNSKVSQLGIGDLWDNPATTANENQYDRFWQQGQSFLNGDVGKHSASNRSQIQNSLNSLSGLRQKRAAEEARANQFRNSLDAELDGLSTTFGQLDIGDVNSINAVERDLSRLKSKRDGFSSSVWDQLGGRSAGEQQFSQFQNSLTDLRGRRAAEENRIAGFENDLYSASDGFFAQLDGLSIADADGMNALRRDLDGKLREARRFRSDIDFDLSDELAELSDVNSRLGGLFDKRSAEEARIRAAEQDFTGRADVLLSAMDGGSIYDLNRINDFGHDIRKLRNKVTGFDSELSHDFSDIDFAALEASKADLLARRQAALDPFSQNLEEIGGDIGSLALEAEDERNARISDLLDLRAQMGSFTGSDVNDLRTRIGSNLDTLHQQAEQLTGRRTEIMSDAEAALTAIEGGSYFSMDDVAARQTEAQQLAALVEQFGVSSAEDEVSEIERFLNGETARLEGDQQHRLARQRQGEQQAQAMLAHPDAFSDGLLAQSHLSDDQIMQILANSSTEDGRLAASGPGAFSQLLGIS